MFLNFHRINFFDNGRILVTEESIDNFTLLHSFCLPRKIPEQISGRTGILSIRAFRQNNYSNCFELTLNENHNEKTNALIILRI